MNIDHMIVRFLLGRFRCDVRLGTQTDFLPAFPNSHSHSLLLTLTPSQSSHRRTHHPWREHSTQIKRRISSRCRETRPRVYSLLPAKPGNPSHLAAHPLARRRCRLRNSTYRLCLGGDVADRAFDDHSALQVCSKSRRARTGTLGPLKQWFLLTFRLCPTDVLEPAGEDPSPPVEAHKVTNTKKTPPPSWVVRFTLLGLS